MDREWRGLEVEGLCAPYQRAAWASQWYRHVCPVTGQKPAIVTIRQDNSLACLLPLVVSRVGPVRVLGFAGGDHSNINLPVIASHCLQTLGAQDFLAAMKEAARSLRVDLCDLRRQPARWEKWVNPLAAVGTYKTERMSILKLDDARDGSPPPDLSKATRRKFSQKQKWLDEIGTSAYRRVTDVGEVAETLDVFYEQKHDRLSAQRIDNPFIKPGIRAFLLAVATADLEVGHPGMDLFTLTSGGKTVAVFGGCVSRNRLSGSIISFDGDSAFSRCSPGELLALHVIKDAWINKLEIFDLGAGNDAYKSRFCNEHEELVSTYLPISALGYAMASLQSLTRRGKRYARSIRATAERVFQKV